MTSEKLSLVVTDSCLLPAKRMPEDSEMIINTDYLTGLIFSDPAELVISSYKIPAHMELTNHNEYKRGVQETTFPTGEMVIGNYSRL